MLSPLWQSIAADYAAYHENTRPLDLAKDEWPGWEGNHLRRLKGTTNLSKAYVAAMEAETVEDHLLFARILFSMYREHTRCMDDHESLRFYIAPGWEQVKKAVANGQRLTAKELAYYQETFEDLSYQVTQTTESPEQDKQAYAMIDGLSEIPDFCFHDSKPVHFEHGSDYALLTLEYYDIRLILEFDNPYEIQVNGDPLTNWIKDFHCYRSFRNPKHITFDVGYYHIECEGVRVKFEERKTKNE